ncbi:MAG: pyruvate kinase [Bacteroidia bacterium]|nr:pyruvate kinase [Bacteroidia bacterium]MCX7651767.1 pyruvate kinase [Bacteroidia bacterium]MDW8416361.1 pyruvate kinase [Bacteroidia bacterium]
MISYNRAKIIATAGPACESEEVLRQLIEAGVDVIRLNLSHGTWETHVEVINKVRRLNLQLGTRVALLADLQGPKMRVGKLPQAVPIRPGDVITFSTRPDANSLPVEYETLAQDVQKGDIVLVEDGRVRLRVLETDKKSTVKLEVIAGDRIGSRKGINLPGRPISLPTLSDKDWGDLVEAIRQEVDWVAISFVRYPSDIQMVQHTLRRFGSSIRVMAKIERPEALENLEEIVALSDGVMVARGDLGVEIPVEEVPFWQKRIIRTCNTMGKPVVVATQMLESMIQNLTPTRAEVTDVANAVLDGADAVMLSGETSVGAFPVEAVRQMQRVLYQAEKEPQIYRFSGQPSPSSPTYHSDAVCWTACTLASEVGARALVGLTYSGYTAFQLARWRPQTDIFIFTPNSRILSSLNLLWGVRAYYYRRHERTFETIQDILHILRDLGHVESGDTVIFTVSMPLRARLRTNTLHIARVQ